MTFRIKKFVLLALMLAMPLQGIAATLSVLLCRGDAQAQFVHAHDSHEHGASHDGHHDDGGTSGYHGDHPCSHYSVSAPAVVTLPAALPDFPVRAFAPDPLHDRFVPELPHRPPLA